MKILVLLVAATALVAAQEQEGQRGLIRALNKRRAALAARIGGIMRKSKREKNNKDASGKTFSGNSGNRYYQYQLDDNTHVYDTYTYYDEEKPTTENNEQTGSVRDYGDDGDYNQQYPNQQYQDQNQQQVEYTHGEFVPNENRRPLSSLISRLSSLFGRRPIDMNNIDETRSVELTNLLNEQIEIDKHIEYIQSTGQARSKQIEADDDDADKTFNPLELSRSNIGETEQTTGRQAGGTGVFVPFELLQQQQPQAHKDHHNTYYNGYYQISKPQGWVVKPLQHISYPQTGSSYYKPVYKPQITTYPYPIYYKPIENGVPFLKAPQSGQYEDEDQWFDVPRVESDSTASLREKLESIENQIDYIMNHTDTTAGNRPYILFDLEVQRQDLKNKIMRIEYSLEHNVPQYFKK